MSLLSVGEALRSKAWRDIPAPARAVYEAEIEPKNGFSPEQRQWVAKWWLSCTQADVDAINATLPAGTRVEAISINGGLYLGCDLLTDMASQKSTYYKARRILDRLTWTNIEKANDTAIYPSDGAVAGSVRDGLK